jgi:S1-C subfamily serine protease
MADTWAARVGLEPGDVLLTFGGAPVVVTRDLVTVLRIVGSGTEVAVTASRDDGLISASAVM